MKISAGSDTGRLRSSNQDSYKIGELEGGAWAVVCDGMGGHSGGNVASSIAVERIERDLKSNLKENMAVSSVKNVLESAIASASADIFDRAAEQQELLGMGTTVVAAVCINGSCVIAHVGDSRCYLLSDGKLNLLTKDHSLVQELVDAGIITPETAQTHPNKNIITRALGTDNDVRVDFTDISLSSGDKLLLCSDGLTNMVSETEIVDCISGEDVFNYSAKLIALANEHGGTDNITAVILAS